MLTTDQVYEQRGQAQRLIEHVGTQYPDDTYEDGVNAALSWVLGESAAPIGKECFELGQEVANDRHA